MKVSKLIKDWVKGFLASQGYLLLSKDLYQSYAPTETRWTMAGAVRTLAQRKSCSFQSVIDVGASDGSWSELLMYSFPECQHLLIEAQPVHEQALKHFCQRHPNAQFVLAAAGNAVSEIYFDAGDPLGGQASYSPYESNCIRVPMTTIDHEIQVRQLKPPYLIKLDTHGFEVPILEGAAATLKNTQVLVIECYNFKISSDCLLFFEMCEYLQRLNFRCIDCIDVLYRPFDQALWQMDLVFVKNENGSDFASTRYD